MTGLPGERARQQCNPLLEFCRAEATYFEAARPEGLEPSTRHDQLLRLIGATFYQAGRGLSKRNAELQYDIANPVPVASLSEHLLEFDEAWSGMERQWCAKLSALERAKFERLTTDTDRDAFRIIHNWSKSESPDFKIHCRTLADRLGVTLQTASNIRRRFCSLGVLKHVAPYVPHRLAARYKWTAGLEPKRKQGAFLSPAVERRSRRRGFEGKAGQTGEEKASLWD